MYIYTIYIHKSDGGKIITREKSQAREWPCPIDVFMEPIFTLLITTYLPKEENVILDWQLVPTLY